MESNDREQSGFRFLNDPQVQKHFAALNIELLRGRHIMPSLAASFAILIQYKDDLIYYYHTIYRLKLEKRTHDSVTYFYLEFPEAGKGHLSDPRLFVEMDAKTTIVTFILANLYFANYFSYDKKFLWEDIHYEIEHGEYKEAYQHLFFNDVRQHYTDKEWDTVKGKFSTAINFLHRIGMVEKEESEEDLNFTILPTIHHFIDMYKNEVEHIDVFLKEIKL